LFFDDDKGKYDIFLSFFDIVPFLLVIFFFFPLQDWSYSDGYIGSMTLRSILICLVIRVGLG